MTEQPIATLPWRATLRLTPLATSALIVGFAVLLFLPSIIYGAPTGHSWRYNVIWLDAFSEVLSLSNPYPRWLPSLWAGAGSPDFYFYAPLFFYLGAGAKVLCQCAASDAQSYAALVLHALSGLGIAHLCRRLNLGEGAACIGAVVFMLLPYHLADWTLRNSVGELAAAGMLGFLLGALVDSLTRDRGHLLLAAGTAWVAFAHLPSLVMLAFVGGGVAMALRGSVTPGRFLRTCIAGGLGFLAVAAYWVPAILLLDTVNSGFMMGFHWSNHIFTFAALFDGEFVGQLFRPAFGLSLLAGIGLLLVWRGEAQRTAAPAVALAIMVICWFMMSLLSRIFWEHTPVDRIQFPWRFLLMLDIALALAAALLVERIAAIGGAARLRAACTGLLVAFVAAVLFWMPAWVSAERGLTRPHWALEERVSVLEWIGLAPSGPHGLTHRIMRDLGHLPAPLHEAPLLQVVEGEGRLEALEEGGRRLLFRAACDEGCTVIIRRNYWPFWSLQAADGGAVALEATEGFPLLTARLPAGDGVYRLALARPPAELAGWGVSGAALLVGALLLLYRRRRRGGEGAWDGRGQVG